MEEAEGEVAISVAEAEVVAAAAEAAEILGVGVAAVAKGGATVEVDLDGEAAEGEAARVSAVEPSVLTVLAVSEGLSGTRESVGAAPGTWAAKAAPVPFQS